MPANCFIATQPTVVGLAATSAWTTRRSLAPFERDYDAMMKVGSMCSLQLCLHHFRLAKGARGPRSLGAHAAYHLSACPRPNVCVLTLPHWLLSPAQKYSKKKGVQQAVDTLKAGVVDAEHGRKQYEAWQAAVAAAPQQDEPMEAAEVGEGSDDEAILALLESDWEEEPAPKPKRKKAPAPKRRPASKAARKRSAGVSSSRAVKRRKTKTDEEEDEGDAAEDSTDYEISDSDEEQEHSNAPDEPVSQNQPDAQKEGAGSPEADAVDTANATLGQDQSSTAATAAAVPAETAAPAPAELTNEDLDKPETPDPEDDLFDDEEDEEWAPKAKGPTKAGRTAKKAEKSAAVPEVAAAEAAPAVESEVDASAEDAAPNAAQAEAEQAAKEKKREAKKLRALEQKKLQMKEEKKQQKKEEKKRLKKEEKKRKQAELLKLSQEPANSSMAKLDVLLKESLSEDKKNAKIALAILTIFKDQEVDEQTLLANVEVITTIKQIKKISGEEGGKDAGRIGWLGLTLQRSCHRRCLLCCRLAGLGPRRGISVHRWAFRRFSFDYLDV